MIQTATKKPITIEFIKFNGHNYDDISKFIGQELKPKLESETAYVAGQGAPIFSIEILTLEGVMKGMTGDYIIKGIKGEFYPCKPDIFIATYDIHFTEKQNNSAKYHGSMILEEFTGLSFVDAMKYSRQGRAITNPNISGWWRQDLNSTEQFLDSDKTQNFWIASFVYDYIKKYE